MGSEHKHEQRLIWLHSTAPLKPALGRACNGCGVCCAAEPCPVARVFLWQWRDSCRALAWLPSERQYRCGLLLAPSAHIRLLPSFLQRPFRYLAARWIAAGTACDSDAQADQLNIDYNYLAHREDKGK
ncbi:hypothetical protein EJG51_007235 [Undibacterium piscinae]|jgi:hypothetical protein|uniref:4Fe-4S ferredoxin-type domain-containing protein n=1 Tax=Undibacterium piscinae TaxID=2495591 RepID=A0A6M4A390_9BURK|nr:hypothetical protein EJG51_007235 [Undibacterium piscinae]